MRTSLLIGLVDDDRVYQFTTERMLLRIDADVRFMWFKDGEEALGFLLSHADEPSILPDMLLLDINMPFMDGWQFLDAFHANKSALCKTIEIFIISSSSDERDQAKAKNHRDVTDYLEKPITTDLLRSLLEGYQQRHDS